MITFLCFGDHCRFLFYLNPVPYIILIRCSAEMVLAVWARCTSFASLWLICYRLMTHLLSAYDSSAIGLWLICHRLMAHLPSVYGSSAIGLWLICHYRGAFCSIRRCVRKSLLRSVTNAKLHLFIWKHVEIGIILGFFLKKEKKTLEKCWWFKKNAYLCNCKQEMIANKQKQWDMV